MSRFEVGLAAICDNYPRLIGCRIININMKRPIALLFCLLMITVPMAGCLGGDDSSDAPNEELADWNVHFAATAADLPTCDEDTNGRLYYVEADNQFQVCKTSGWSVIDIQGSDGQVGVDGQNGIDGKNALIRVTSSITCSSGGYSFEIGQDINYDGILEVSEVEVNVDICNGSTNSNSNGQQGSQGPPGVNGTDGAPGPQGPPGVNGTDGKNVIILTYNESQGSNCYNGGVRIDAGIDDNDDGILQNIEIDTSQYVCDGGSSSLTLLTSYSLPNSNLNCDLGGSVISHGLDNGDNNGIAANGQLETGEIDSITTICTKSSFTKLFADLDRGIEYDNKIFFRTSTGEYGSELWAFDGINSPYLVADINPGTGSSVPRDFLVFDDILYFRAYDGNNGRELWSYDASTDLASLVEDISVGSSSSDPQNLVLYQNELWFSASDGIHGTELWRYDGSNSPSMVSDFNTGSSGSNPASITVFDDELFFSAYLPSVGRELFRYSLSNSVSNMTLVSDINSNGNSNPDQLYVHNNELFFQANDGIHGTELWKLAGQYSSPSLVADIYNGSSNGVPTGFTTYNNELFFRAGDANYGYELWKFDGTNAPSMIGDINFGSNSSYCDNLISHDNLLYFKADDGIHGYQLWRYDGISFTMLTNWYSLSSLSLYFEELYLDGNDNTYGNLVWKFEENTIVSYS